MTNDSLYSYTETIMSKILVNNSSHLYCCTDDSEVTLQFPASDTRDLFLQFYLFIINYSDSFLHYFKYIGLKNKN